MKAVLAFKFFFNSSSKVLQFLGLNMRGQLQTKIVCSVGISGTDVHCPETPPLEVRLLTGDPFSINVP